MSERLPSGAWAPTRNIYVEEVTFLTQNGETNPERIAHHFGTTTEAIARGLYRARRADLARPFSNLAQRKRRKQRRAATPTP